MNKKKSIISILIIISILAALFVNTYAADTGKMVIELKAGSSTGSVNGVASKVEKPYVKNKTVMVPLTWVATAIGAEVNQKANNKAEIIYGEMSAEIAVGSRNYTANSASCKLSVAPEAKNGKIMVPLEFISKNFPVSITTDLKKGSVKIVLEDDGALSDLSFLTGGISSPKVGNSYYGWSINVPSGSRIISNSFKSDRIGITNESRGLYFEVCAENKNERTLSELYSDIQYDSTVRQSKIDLKAPVPYFEYIRLSEYEQSLRVRVFDKGDYFYYVTINSYDNSVTPEKLMSDKYYNNIISSFDLNYKGNVKGVEDLTKIKQGKAIYYNYVSLDNDAKYLPWSINIPAKWGKVLSDKDPLTTNLGVDSQHYMKITMNTIGEENLDEYVKDVKNSYDKNFNPKLYSFISSDTETIAGTEANKLKFSIKQGKNVDIVDEYYFIKNGFVYEISIKLPENEYKKYDTEFTGTVNEMTFYNIDETAYKKALEQYENKNMDARVSQQDDPFEYKMDNWSINIPGYWTKSSSYEFANPNTGANIEIDSVENNSLTKTLSDKEKFKTMKLLETIYQITPTQSTISDKGCNIRTYNYKLEDDKSNLFVNITCYCFESGDYSYCYISSLPDLTATEAATKELEDIWKSFKLIKKNQN